MPFGFKIKGATSAFSAVLHVKVSLVKLTIIGDMQLFISLITFKIELAAEHIVYILWYITFATCDYWAVINIVKPLPFR